MRCPYCFEEALQQDAPCTHCGRTGVVGSTSRIGFGMRMDHYQIGAKLGQGGMGAVYKAWDHTLNRRVAIKILTLKNLDAEDEYMIQEARAASALNHPHIVTIYDVSRQARCNYITMELVEGRTLKDLMKKESLPLSRTLNYACQIASGLAAAHEKSIIHRDIKPHNIMVDLRDQARILDFGLAKIGDRPFPEGVSHGQSHQTQTGQLKGTLAYMSPEQARGEPIDPATDVFSFGILLYAMITGVHPFEGASGREFKENILFQDPRPLGDHVEELPPSLQVLMDGCLEKEPRKRIQSMVQVEERLRRIQEEFTVKPIRRRAWMLGVMTTAALFIPALLFYFRQDAAVKRDWVQPGQTLAVLPLGRLQNDAAQKILGAGLSRDLYQLLVARMDQNSGIWIPSEEQMFNAEPHVQYLKNQLGAHWVITGHVQSFGQTARCSLSLVETDGLRQVATTEIDFEMDRIHLVRPRLAEALNQLLGLPNTALELPQIPSQTQAYSEYLAGLFYMEKNGENMLNSSVDALSKAMTQDPGFHPAIAVCARVRLSRAEQFPHWRARDQAWFGENDAFLKENMALQVRRLHLKGKSQEAAVFLETWVEHNPSHVQALNALTRHYGETDQWEKARITGEIALQLEPQNLEVRATLGRLAQKHCDQETFQLMTKEILKRAPAHPWALSVETD